MEELLLTVLLRGSRFRPVARPQLSLVAIDEQIAFLHVHAIETSTRRNYTTGARDYILFCSIHGIPLDPTPLTLARYIAYTSARIASAPKYLSGACHFLRDIYPDFDSARKHALVQTTIRGSRKVRADPIHQKQPLRPSHLVTLHTNAALSQEYDDFLFATILTIAFFACHRIGELLHSADWRKVIRRTTFSSDDRDHASFRLPCHKGDSFYRGTTILLSRATATLGIDPVATLRDYVQRRDRLHCARTPLFLRADGSQPTHSWFENRFFRFLPRSDYGGHSAHAGGATHYASLSLSEPVIMAIGRWSSQSWTAYLRDHPTVRAELELHARRPPLPAGTS